MTFPSTSSKHDPDILSLTLGVPASIRLQIPAESAEN